MSHHHTSASSSSSSPAKRSRSETPLPREGPGKPTGQRKSRLDRFASALQFFVERDSHYQSLLKTLELDPPAGALLHWEAEELIASVTEKREPKNTIFDEAKEARDWDAWSSGKGQYFFNDNGSLKQHPLLLAASANRSRDLSVAGSAVASSSSVVSLLAPPKAPPRGRPVSTDRPNESASNKILLPSTIVGRLHDQDQPTISTSPGFTLENDPDEVSSTIVEIQDRPNFEEENRNEIVVSPSNSPRHRDAEEGTANLTVLPDNADDRIRAMFMPPPFVRSDQRIFQREIQGSASTRLSNAFRKPYELNSYEFCKDNVGDIARAQLLGRQRSTGGVDGFVYLSTETNHDYYANWHGNHRHRWGDRADWEGLVRFGKQDNHAIPRLYVPTEALKKLYVTVRIPHPDYNAHRTFYPFRNTLRYVNKQPVAYNPCIRLQDYAIKPEGESWHWHAPENDSEYNRYILGLEQPTGPFSVTFRILGDTTWHPLQRAIMDKFTSFKTVFFCFYRFLQFFHLDFDAGDGVLFRDDARILYSQTSEFPVRQPIQTENGFRIGMRTPSLVFRMGGLHYAWWHAGTQTGDSPGATGTARIYSIEGDRELYIANGRHFALYGIHSYYR